MNSVGPTLAVSTFLRTTIHRGRFQLANFTNKQTSSQQPKPLHALYNVHVWLLGKVTKNEDLGSVW